MRIVDILQKHFGDRIALNKDISLYFTLKMRTHAQYYLEAETVADWQKAALVTSENNIPLFILGGGSNVAVMQPTIPGLVVRNRYIKKEVVCNSDQYVDLLLGSGYPMGQLVKETIAEGLSGFEYHLGLPGTLGGAMYMNSKWMQPETYVSDTLLIATVMSRDGDITQETREYFQFAYDYSILQKTREIFLEGIYRLTKHDAKELEKRSQEALAYRKETQPFGVATGGCFFQNISEEEKTRNNLETTSAGYLIDHAGLKGKKIGAFQISDKHANFIINTGDGQQEDLRALLQFIKDTIKEKYDVSLKEEVVTVQ